VDKV
jgi:aminopeptidase N